MKKTFSELASDEIASKIRTAIASLQHRGETGKNIESIVAAAIRPYVPTAFGIDTGFVRSLQEPGWQSHQIDVLFTRQDVCHPLAVFPDTRIYPIESIIGFMEVTKAVDKRKLEKDFEKVKDLKHMVQRQFRISKWTTRRIGLLADSPEPQTEKEVLAERITRVPITLSDLEPRFFYFAFTSKWKSVESVCENLATVGKDRQMHLHGMMILDKGYFKHMSTNDAATAYRIAYIADQRQAYITFIHDIIDSLQTFMPIPPGASIPIDQYNLIGGGYQLFES